VTQERAAGGACPLCGGADFAPSRFGLLACGGCGLIVAPSVWRPSENEALNRAFFGDGYEPVTSFWVRRFETANNLRTLRRLPPGGGRLLEIGVGSGSFLAAAAARGYAAVGCDLSPEICARVAARTGLAVHCGGPDAVPGAEPFDAVVMNHVLEHAADPLALLRAARARLKPGGVLHLAVPNVAAPEARLAGWNSYEPYHLLFFTPETARRAAEAAGFEGCVVTTHESFSGWFLAILRSALRRGPERPAPRARAGAAGALEHAYRLAMILCGAASWPLRKIQERLGMGDEVVVLARSSAHAS
jgi:SAM-dependent methyltransferase